MRGHNLTIILCLAAFPLFLILPPKARAAGVAPISLQESIELALKISPLSKAAKEGTKGAEAQKKEAFTAFLPRLSTSYSYTRIDKTPSFTIPGSPPIPATTVVTGSRDNYNWVLEARQPLFTGGALLANYEASLIGMEMARLEERIMAENIILDTSVSYYAIGKAERLREVARQTLEQLTAHRDVANYYFSAGLIAKNDLLHAEVELAGGRQLLLRAENALALAEARFNTLLRRDLSARVLIEKLPPQEGIEWSLAQCLEIAMQNRPELKVYDLRTKQAMSMVKLAKSEYLPSVNLVGNYARYGDDPSVSGSNYRDQESWQVMAVANWNFWEWGKTKNRVDLSRARENQARYARENLQDQLALEVQNAYLQLDEARKQIAVAETALTAAEENLRISRERYLEQVATSTEVIDASTRLTRVNSDYYNALGDYHISRAKLKRAMGR